MRLNNVKFVISSPSSNNWIDDDLKEIVILGKSNVGKSTFINMLTDNKNLAKTSQTPGRTRLLNFFSVDNKYRLVDAPGYGYASINYKMDLDFNNMMEEYFDKRKNLAGAILLIDSRRVPSNDDLVMLNFIVEHNLPFILVATKCDKLNQSEKSKIVPNFINNLNLLSDTKIILASNNKFNWVDEVINRINYILDIK